MKRYEKNLKRCNSCGDRCLQLINGNSGRSVLNVGGINSSIMSGRDNNKAHSSSCRNLSRWVFGSVRFSNRCMDQRDRIGVPIASGAGQQPKVHGSRRTHPVTASQVSWPE